MASLARLKQNTPRVQDGDWIDVGYTPDDLFRIRTRGQTPRYLTLLNQYQREAARSANRGLAPGAVPFRADDLPPALSNRCTGRAMAEETFLDVEGLDGENGVVTADEFRTFLLDPETYGSLIFLTYSAMLKIHEERADEIKAAAGNSAAVSAGT